LSKKIQDLKEEEKEEKRHLDIPRNKGIVANYDL